MATPLLAQVASSTNHLMVLMSLDLPITSLILMGLASIKGYQLELVQAPQQQRPMPAINCSIKQREMISKEIRELLAKGVVVETTPSQKGFVSQIFLW